MNDFQSTNESAQSAGFSTTDDSQSAVCGCPLEGGQSEPSVDPCYAEEMTVGTKDGKQSVTWTQASRSRDYTRAQTSLLAGDDLLLQCVVDHDTQREGGKPLDVFLTGVTTPACPKGEHPKMSWHEVSGSTAGWESTEQKTFVETVSSRKPKHYGETLFDRYWPYGKKGCRTYRFTLESCGIHSDASKTAQATVNGRIEAYRKSEYRLIIKLPALAGKAAHRSSKFDVTTRKTTTARTDTETSNFGRTKSGSSLTFEESSYSGTNKVTYSTTRTTASGIVKTVAHSSGTENFAETSGRTTTYETGDSLLKRRQLSVVQAPDEDLKVEKQDVHPTGVTLKVNGTDVDAVKFLSAALTLPATVSKFLADMKQAVPKVGWQADASVSVFQGTFDMGWTLEPADSAMTPEIWALTRFWDFNVICDLVKIEISIGFGIEWVIANPMWDPPLVELILVVKISIVATASAKLQLKTSTKNTFAAETKVESVPKISAEAKAMVNGFGARAYAEIKTGIEGKLEFKGGFEATPDCKATLGFKPIEVTAECEAFGKKIKADLFKYPSRTTPLWEADLLSSKTTGSKV